MRSVKHYLPGELAEIRSVFTEAKFELYLVGGGIRDILMGRPARDFDFATSARPEQIIKLFPHTIPTGIKHGTVTVLYKNKPYEVTTFRSEGAYSDNRRPDAVSFSDSLEEDIQRRDFTVNAIACDVETGRLIDLHGGQKDIEKKIIRTIGDPQERFSEDALRMMRACRFCAQLGFSMDEETLEGVKKERNRIDCISVERIRDEFIKILQSPKPSLGIEFLRETGLLKLLLPEVLRGYGVHQNQYHKYDVYHHSLKVLDAMKNPDHRLRLAALFHDVAKPLVKKKVPHKQEPVFYNHEYVGARVTKSILQRMKFSNEDIRLVTHLVRNHMFHYTQEWNGGTVRRFIRKIEPENLEYLFQLREADRQGSGTRSGKSRELEELRRHIETILKQENALKIKDLDISGNDLMETFHLKPSRRIGEILKYLLEAVLDDPTLNAKEKLLEKAKTFLNTCLS